MTTVDNNPPTSDSNPSSVDCRLSSVNCVLFDFDGTLARTASDMTAALNAMLRARGRPPIDAALATARVSGGARAMLEAAGFSDDEMPSARNEFLRLYEETGYRRTDLFPRRCGVVVGNGANGLELGVVTNKPRRYFAPIADRLGWTGNANDADGANKTDGTDGTDGMDGIGKSGWSGGNKLGLIAGDDCPRAKPHPDGLLRAAELLGVAPSRCVYVGDDPRDARAAKAARMPFILAAWGYWTPSQWPPSVKVSALAATPSDILPLAKTPYPDAG